MKPIGITVGDASGVGPEILLRSYTEGTLQAPCVVFGDIAALEACRAKLSLSVPIRTVACASEAQPGSLCVVDAAMLQSSDLTPGTLNAKAGAAAYQYIVQATTAALRGETAGIVTLPVNKAAIEASHPGFSGHTELLGELCGAPDVTILLASEQLIVSHVSTHVSLREAIARVKTARVHRIIELTCDTVARLRTNPRIAVAGLNPHASEHGLFGDEEENEIGPAVEAARAQGLPVEGPFPPDTLFYLAVREKRFDAIVCMYHDQGHIPLKLLDFDGGVNITLGLPILRTSVDHGTAFDIAWQGKARTRSFREALQYAQRLAGG